MTKKRLDEAPEGMEEAPEGTVEPEFPAKGEAACRCVRVAHGWEEPH